MTLSLRFARVTGWLHRNRLAMLLIALVCFAITAQFASAYVPVIDDAKAMIYLFLAILGYVYTVIAFAIGKLIVVLIGMIIIPILGYNDFGSSFIISIGWPLVRDIMNMFVILILILIAIKTILGIGGGAQAAQQNILKLFLAVVAMNFSRTICVLIIDFGQVIMMTFVNALQDIAAGNFVGLFQLNSFLGTSIDIPAFDTGALSGGFDAISYLGSAYLMLVLMAIVLGVISIIAVVFIYRIVILWVLTILSPLAFFLMGVPLEGAKGYASEWRKKFVGAVTLGPILTFFLWLALATAGQGSLVATEGFPTAGTEDSVGLLTDIFETDKMLSLFIGILLLFVGLQASSSAANALGDFSGKAIKSGQDFVKWAAAAPAKGTYAVGREGVRQLEARTGVVSKIGKGAQVLSGSVLGSSVGKIPLLGGAVKGGARLVAKGGSALEKSMGAQSEERIKGANESVGKEGMDHSLAELSVFERDDFDLQAENWSAEERIKGKVRSAEYLANAKFEKADRKRLKAQGLDDSTINSVIESKKQKMMNMVGDDLKDIYGGGDAGADKAFKAKAANLHLLQKKDENGNFVFDEAAVKDVVADRKFNLNILGGSAVQDARVQSILHETKVGTRKDKNGNEVPVSYLDKIKSGQGSADVRAAWRGEGADKSFIRGEVPKTRLNNIIGAEEKEVERARWEEESKSKAEMAGRAMMHGQIDVSSEKLTLGDMGGEIGGVQYDDKKMDNLARALIEARGQAKGMDDMDQTIRNGVVARMNEMKDSAQNNDEREKIEVAVTRVSRTAPSDHLDGLNGGFLERDNDDRLTGAGERGEQVVREIAKSPTELRRLGSDVNANFANDISRIIVENSEKANEQLIKAFQATRSITNQPDRDAQQNAIRESVDVLRNALQAQANLISQSIIDAQGRGDSGAEKRLRTQLARLQQRQQKARYLDHSVRSPQKADAPYPAPPPPQRPAPPPPSNPYGGNQPPPGWI